jgi:hypothetical protein
MQLPFHSGKEIASPGQIFLWKMALFSVRRLVSLMTLFAAAAAQVPGNLPVDQATKQYLESLSPDKLAAILKIYEQGLAGQTPASPDLIAAQELTWSYGRSPPVYPTRESNPSYLLGPACNPLETCSV